MLSNHCLLLKGNLTLTLPAFRFIVLPLGLFLHFFMKLVYMPHFAPFGKMVWKPLKQHVRTMEETSSLLMFLECAAVEDIALFLSIAASAAAVADPGAVGGLRLVGEASCSASFKD